MNGTKKKNKKKLNPNLFSFLIDPDTGLFSPILKGLPTSMVTTLRNITDISQDAFVEHAKTQAAKAAAGRISVSQCPSPSAATSAAGGFAGTIQSAIRELNYWSVAAEAATLGMLDVTIAQFQNEPFFKSYGGVAADVMRAEADYGFLPMVRRHWLGTYKPLLPEPYRLASMKAKHLIEDGIFLSAMHENGLTSEWASLWSEEQRLYPDYITTLALLRRGEIDDDTFWLWLTRTNYGSEEIAKMKVLKDVIPPIPDLTRMAVREAFGDHTYEAQYPAYENWAVKMGLSKEFAANYWYAHWERIPLRQMYDNLWRELWTPEQFDRMLRIKDVHPDDRQAILDVAYLPPSIREMGYGYDMGVYSRDDIVRYRKMGGLSPADSLKAADSLVRYRISAEMDAVRREYMYAFSYERITYEEYVQALLDLNTPDAALPFWIQRGELLLERNRKPTQDIEGRVISSSEARWGFKNNIISETQFRALLKQLDWTEDRIELMVKRLKVEMEPEPVEPEEVKIRLLTVSQLTNLLKVGEIEETYLDAKLTELGYTDESIILLKKLIKFAEPPIEKVKPFTSATAVGLYDFEMFDEEDLLLAYQEMGYDDFHSIINVIYARMRLEYPTIRSLYEKGIYSYENMRDEFVKLDLTLEQADSLAYKTRRELQIERLTKERDLTKAEIVKGVKNRVINMMDGVELLMDIGYDKWEAEYILAVNKVVAAGDPEGYWDMKRVTEAYKKARGLKAMEVPAEAIQLEKTINAVRAELETLTKEQAVDRVLAEKAKELNDLELKMKTLLQQKLLR